MRGDLEGEVAQHFRSHAVAQADISKRINSRSSPSGRRGSPHRPSVRRDHGAPAVNVPLSTGLYAPLRPPASVAIRSGRAERWRRARERRATGDGRKTVGMNITCPSCESTYQLADGSLGATGRKVRCTRCGTVWHAMPADGDTLEPEPDTEAIEAAAARFREPSEDEWKALSPRTAPPPRRPRRRTSRAATSSPSARARARRRVIHAARGRRGGGQARADARRRSARLRAGEAQAEDRQAGPQAAAQARGAPQAADQGDRLRRRGGVRRLRDRRRVRRPAARWCASSPISLRSTNSPASR